MATSSGTFEDDMEVLSELAILASIEGDALARKKPTSKDEEQPEVGVSTSFGRGKKERLPPVPGKKERLRTLEEILAIRELNDFDFDPWMRTGALPHKCYVPLQERRQQGKIPKPNVPSRMLDYSNDNIKANYEFKQKYGNLLLSKNDEVEERYGIRTMPSLKRPMGRAARFMKCESQDASVQDQLPKVGVPNNSSKALEQDPSRACSTSSTCPTPDTSSTCCTPSTSSTCTSTCDINKVTQHKPIVDWAAMFMDDELKNAREQYDSDEDSSCDDPISSQILPIGFEIKELSPRSKKEADEKFKLALEENCQFVKQALAEDPTSMFPHPASCPYKRGNKRKTARKQYEPIPLDFQFDKANFPKLG